MIQSKDEIIQQARQGSIAAIIQVLNESFTDGSVRTRAVLDDGMLQLLCEGTKPQQLDQNTLVTHIKEILEAIAPKNFRKVNIYSRIACEHQVLWLEEIKQDPDNQLLWFQEITLKRPNLLQKIKQASQNNYNDNLKQQELLKAAANNKRPHRRKSPNKLVKVSLLGIMVVFGSWLAYDFFKPTLNLKAQQTILTVSKTSESKNISSQKAQSRDQFEQAVNLASEAAIEGTKAQLPVEWLNLAAKWQKASDLMANVPSDHPRYQEAQQKVQEYSNNREIIIIKLQKSQEK